MPRNRKAKSPGSTETPLTVDDAMPTARAGTPLLRLNPRSVHTLHDIRSAVFAAGAIGSGKTSGTEKDLALAEERVRAAADGEGAAEARDPHDDTPNPAK